MMIDEEYTICLRFPRKKRYSPLMFRKMEWIVGYDSYLLWTVKSAFTLYSFSDEKDTRLWISWFFENTFYVQEDAVAPPKVELDTTVGPRWWLPEIGWAVIVTMQL